MTSTEKEQTSPKTAKAAAELPAPRKAAPGVLLSAVGLLLLGILAPALISGALVTWLFAAVNMWQYGLTLAQVVFAAALVAIALVLSLLLDSLLAPARKRNRKQGVGFGSGPSARLVSIVLGGILLPLGLYAAANLMQIPSQGTAMNALIAVSRQPVKLTPPDEVGSIALQSKNPATKVQGIRVLQGFKSTEALNQLIKIASSDRDALADAGVAGELSTAIASYGVNAKQPLFALFTSIDPAEAGEGGVSADLYERYFAHSFASLQAEIERSAPDSASRSAETARLRAAQAQLEKSLDELQVESAVKAGDPRLDFVLRAFLAMDIQADADLLAFAKQTAADTRFSGQVRGDALLLTGKLGSSADLDGLYAYLKNSDELIQARALQAIAAIQAREAGTAE